MIRTVKEFYIGQLVYYDKKKYRITKFPSRSSVILTHTRRGGSCAIKTTIRDLRQKAFFGKQDIEG
jgi:hypothetical protein